MAGLKRRHTKGKTKNNVSLLQAYAEDILVSLNDGFFICDVDGRFLEVNESFARMTGYTCEEFAGPFAFADLASADDSDAVLDLAASAIASGQPAECEKEIIRRDGSRFTAALTFYPLHSVEQQVGTASVLGAVVRDVTERHLLESQLAFQSLHDPLTGLANKSLLRDRVEHALARSVRRNCKVAVLMLDLDNFKPVNDALGHAAGDALLVLAGERLRACLRMEDTPARLGGDEFAVLIDDIREQGEELQIAERILDAFRSALRIDGKDVFITVSIGIAVSGGPGCDIGDDLLQKADVAMWAAKNQGKNQFAVFQESMRTAVVRRVQIEGELRRAMQNGEFKIRYQPVFDIVTGHVVAAEALIRWDHPNKLRVSPGEFVPVAEDAGLISEIGRLVLEAACGQCASWQRRFRRRKPLALTVNISGQQLRDPGFVESVRSTLAKVGLPAGDLVLEITETTMLSNTEMTIRKMEELRRLGVRLAIDDFGTGYSALSCLQRFPFDILKIDRAFVEKVTDRAEGEAIMRAIISMCEALSLKTVAEGIEKPEQISALKELGCRLGQGFYFARPLTVGDMEALLHREAAEYALELAEIPAGQGVITAPNLQRALT